MPTARGLLVVVGASASSRLGIMLPAGPAAAGRQAAAAPQLGRSLAARVQRGTSICADAPPAYTGPQAQSVVLEVLGGKQVTRASTSMHRVCLPMHTVPDAGAAATNYLNSQGG